MSTRSRIAYNDGKNVYMSVYCHFDGYVEGVGQVLFHYYNDFDKAKALVDGGDMSSVSPNVNDISRYDDGDTYPLICEGIKELIDYFDKSDQEFLYVFEDGRWTYFNKEYGSVNYMGKLADALRTKGVI